MKLAVGSYCLLVITGAVWGLSFSLARLATAYADHPLGLALWQSLFGSVILLSLCCLRRRWPRLSAGYLKIYLLLGLIGTAIPGTLYFYAAPHVPAGILAITIASVPLLTYAGSWLFGLDALSPLRMSGLVAGLLAIVLLTAPETSLPDRAMVAWILLALLAACFYTVENLYVALRIPAATDMLALLCGMLIAATVMLLPLVWLTGTFVKLNIKPSTLELAVLGIAAINSLAYASYLYIIQRSGPVFASQTGYVVTLSGVGWGIVFFAERHSAWVWLALVLMIIGLLLVTPKTTPAPILEHPGKRA